jgi:hypothetical protein
MTRYRRRYRRRPVPPRSQREGHGPLFFVADLVAGFIGARQPRTQTDANNMVMIPVILMATLFFCLAVLMVMWLVNHH